VDNFVGLSLSMLYFSKLPIVGAFVNAVTFDVTYDTLLFLVDIINAWDGG